MNKVFFLKRYGITEKKFSGEEKIFGDLNLGSLTSIPEGFNPTVGGDLYLGSLTSIPKGFNPTVGGSLFLDSVTYIPEEFNPIVGDSLYLRSLTSIPGGFSPVVGNCLELESLASIPKGFKPIVGQHLCLNSLSSTPKWFNPKVNNCVHFKGKNKYIGAKVAVPVTTNFFWEKEGKRYAKIDGIFCEILTERKRIINGAEYSIYSAKKIARPEIFFIAGNGTHYAHGKDLKTAVADLEYKIVAEKIKKEPIHRDTKITAAYYRAITGACKFGIKDWIKKNGLTDKSEMSAEELLPILQETNAYGYRMFKRLVTF